MLHNDHTQTVSGFTHRILLTRVRGTGLCSCLQDSPPHVTTQTGILLLQLSHRLLRRPLSGPVCISRGREEEGRFAIGVPHRLGVDLSKSILLVFVWRILRIFAPVIPSPQYGSEIAFCPFFFLLKWPVCLCRHNCLCDSNNSKGSLGAVSSGNTQKLGNGER